MGFSAFLIWSLICQEGTSFSDKAAAMRVAAQQYRQCGVNCLYVTSHMLGKECQLSQLDRMLNSDRTEGNSLQELADAATELGFFPVAVNFSTDRFDEVPSPAILHVRTVLGATGDHFVVYLGSNGNRALILDPPHPPTAVLSSEFKERWTGVALIPTLSDQDASTMRRSLGASGEASIYREPGLWCFVASSMLLLYVLARRSAPSRATIGVGSLLLCGWLAGCGSSKPVDKPRLVLADPFIDFGMVDSDTKPLSIKFSNAGTSVLRINNVSASCTCTVAKASAETNPGTEGEIVLQPPKCGRGSMSAKLTVYSNAPDSPNEVYLTWFCPSPPSLTPSALSVFDAKPGDLHKETVKIVYAGGSETHRIKLLSVEPSDPAISVSEVKDELFAKESQYIITNNRAIVGEQAHIVEWRLPMKRGKHNASVAFMIEQAGEKHRLQLPLSAEVQGKLKVSGTLLFTAADANGLKGQSRSVIVTSDDPAGEIVLLEKPEYVSVDLKKQEGANRYKVDVTFLSAPSPGAESNRIILQPPSDADEAVEIPLRVFLVAK